MELFLGMEMVFELHATLWEMMRSAGHCRACKYWVCSCSPFEKFNRHRQLRSPVILSSIDRPKIQLGGRSNARHSYLRCWAQSVNGQEKKWGDVAFATSDPIGP